MGLEKLKQNLRDSMDAVGDQFSNSLSLLKNLKEAGVEKMNVLVNDILGIAPLIDETGFSMKDISVDIGIPPSIGLSFTKEKEMDPETIDKLLKENSDKELLKLIVAALQKADATQKNMKLGNFKFTGLSMKLGLPPDVSLKFKKS